MNRTFAKQSVWKLPCVRERFSSKKHVISNKPSFPRKDTRSRDPYFLAMEQRVEEFVQEEHDYEEMMKDVYERRIPPPPPPNTPHPNSLSRKDAQAVVLWTDQQIHVACIQLKHPFL